MNKAVIFDLDDTLYPEIEYVKSGFREVSRYLKNFGIDESKSYNFLIEALYTQGRGKLFDHLLTKCGIFNQALLNALIFIYRMHKPSITLYEEVPVLFRELKAKGYKIGIITDGTAIAQYNKVTSLGLHKLMDVIVYTDVLGREYWKPSVVPYEAAVKLLQIDVSRSVYVGDNPKKDFVGANLINMRTIWFNKNMSSMYSFASDVEKPTFTVSSILEILELL